MKNTNTNTQPTGSTSTKTGRKNRTKLTEVLPESGFYTNEMLFALNKSFKEITLRVRVKKLVESGKVLEVGTLHQPKGRPAIVMATAPVSKETWAKIAAAGVLLNEKYSVNVVSIGNTENTTETAAVSTTDLVSA
jgi:hypothetical protein